MIIKDPNASMNKLKYSSHPIWNATIGSKLRFRYRPERESLIHSLVIEVKEMYVLFRATLYKTNGGHFYRLNGDKNASLKYIADYMKYYKKQTEVSFENTEVDMIELIRQTQGNDVADQLLDGKTVKLGRDTMSPRSLRKRLSLNLSPRRLSRSSSPLTPSSSRCSSRNNSPSMKHPNGTPRTPNSSRLSSKHKGSPRLRSLLSPRSRSADNSPRDKESPRETLDSPISEETKKKWTADEEYRHQQQILELDIMLEDLLKQCKTSSESE
mgnify:CR=1 FL=1